MALILLALSASAPAAAQTSGGRDAPTGLERLQDPQQPDKLPLGSPDTPPTKPSEAPPAGTKNLGGDVPNAPNSYTPGRPGSDRGDSDPNTIGGGTRVKKGGSPLDDIH